MNMSQTQIISGRLVHSHHTHASALWDSLMQSHTLACMSTYVNQHGMTHPQYESFSVVLSHSQTFACIHSACSFPLNKEDPVCRHTSECGRWEHVSYYATRHM